MITTANILRKKLNVRNPSFLIEFQVENNKSELQPWKELELKDEGIAGIESKQFTLMEIASARAVTASAVGV